MATARDNTVIDSTAFRNALGAFITGVTIVTTNGPDNKPVGLTANSFNSVSLDPPMVLWSLGLNSGSLPAFRTAKWWAVHILASDQEALSARFASRATDKFEGVEVILGPSDIPLFKSCSARFVCRTAFEYEGGDHAIFVGEVVEFENFGLPPLAFHQGRYARVLPPPPPQAEIVDDFQFGRHFLGHYLGRAHYELFNNIRIEYRRRGLRGREYTVLIALGIGDECTVETLIARAADGGVELAAPTIEGLANRGLLTLKEGKVKLTVAGRQTVIELVAVAQASQARVEDRLADGEIAMLRHLIQRVIDAAPRPRTATD